MLWKITALFSDVWAKIQTIQYWYHSGIVTNINSTTNSILISEAINGVSKRRHYSLLKTNSSAEGSADIRASPCNMSDIKLIWVKLCCSSETTKNLQSKLAAYLPCRKVLHRLSWCNHRNNHYTSLHIFLHYGTGYHNCCNVLDIQV